MVSNLNLLEKTLVVVTSQTSTDSLVNLFPGLGWHGFRSRLSEKVRPSKGTGNSMTSLEAVSFSKELLATTFE